MTSPDSIKAAIAQAALAYIADEIAAGEIIGVGTGSTANCFIDALPAIASKLGGAVASSEATAKRLAAHGIRLVDLNEVESLRYYVDGADEISAEMWMIKGGGGALTREKIVADVAACYICIADRSKRVSRLGRFPLPIEVIPLAVRSVSRHLARIGGQARLRSGFTSDNGNPILDVHGLDIVDAVALETTLNQWPGVVTNGLFAQRPADWLFVDDDQGNICRQQNRQRPHRI